MVFPNYFLIMLVNYFKDIFGAGVNNFQSFLLNILCNILFWSNIYPSISEKDFPTFIVTSLQKVWGKPYNFPFLFF